MPQPWEGRYRQLRSEISTEFRVFLGDSRDDFEEAGIDSVRAGGTRRLIRSETLPELFDYQADLVHKMKEVVASRSAALLSLPTGGGKTRTAVAGVLSAMTSGLCARIVWLAPAVELLDQAEDTFVRTWRDFGAAPDLTLTREHGRREVNLIWLTTPQAIFAALGRSRGVGDWDLVVFDEAHQLAAKTYKASVAALRGVDYRSPLIGLSATPGRSDSAEVEELQEIFGGRLLTSSKLGENPVVALQRRGVLSQLSFRSFSRRRIELDAEAERLVVASRAAHELSRRGRHVLVFTASVAGAYVLEDLLRGLGVSARAVDASLSPSQREAALAAFAHRETTVLINQRLLATGYDCPAVTDVFLLLEVRSPILFEQMVGRAARGVKTGGSARATIWEFDDHRKLHGLPSSYYRFKDYDWS